MMAISVRAVYRNGHLESGPIAGLHEGQEVQVTVQPVAGAKPRSLLDLVGLGREIWLDENGEPIDAQEYVRQLREEWD